MKHHNKIVSIQPGNDPSLDQTVLSRLAALKEMSVKELKAEWEKLIGTSAPNNSRAFLELRIAYRLQELTYGGPDRDTRRMLDLLADEVEGHARRKHQIADPRNPVAGTKLLREWDGVEHTVTVLKDGFDWQARKFKSLSAVAREITGTRWNGWRFSLSRTGCGCTKLPPMLNAGIGKTLMPECSCMSGRMAARLFGCASMMPVDCWTVAHGTRCRGWRDE